MPVNNEQWKGGGDCSVCRKRNYCKTGCKAQEKAAFEKLCTHFQEKIFSDAVKQEAGGKHYANT